MMARMLKTSKNPGIKYSDSEGKQGKENLKSVCCLWVGFEPEVTELKSHVYPLQSQNLFMFYCHFC